MESTHAGVLTLVAQGDRITQRMVHKHGIQVVVCIQSRRERGRGKWKRERKKDAVDTGIEARL